MKIAHVVLTLNYGGLERLVVDLAGQLNQGDWESSIICLSQPGPMAETAQKMGVEVVSFYKSNGFDIGLILRLANLIRKKMIDVVHTHNLAPLVYGTLAAKLAGAGAINTRHGRAPLKANRGLWALNDFIVAVSEDAREELLTANKIDSEKVTVIYNGIDFTRYEPGAAVQLKGQYREGLGIPKDDFVIGSIARLAEEKDHPTLLKAVKILLEERLPVTCVLVGDGDQRKKLEALAEQFKIRDHVTFLGFREDIPQLLNLFDVFVLATHMEGVSMTLLEAMAASKPIVASKVGGNPEVVKDDVTGFLVAPQEEQHLAKAIKYLLKDPILRQKMGQAGRRRVEEKFNIKRMIREYQKIYESLG